MTVRSNLELIDLLHFPYFKKRSLRPTRQSVEVQSRRLGRNYFILHIIVPANGTRRGDDFRTLLFFWLLGQAAIF
jgi:hypothetical protein